MEGGPPDVLSQNAAHASLFVQSTISAEHFVGKLEPELVAHVQMATASPPAALAVSIEGSSDPNISVFKNATHASLSEQSPTSTGHFVAKSDTSCSSVLFT